MKRIAIRRLKILPVAKGDGITPRHQLSGRASGFSGIDFLSLLIRNKERPMESKNTNRSYEVINRAGSKPLKAWTVGVPFADNAKDQLARTISSAGLVPDFEIDAEVVNCHHNYVIWENLYGENVLVTRKGAVRARSDDLGIIPGGMGARSFIVRGKGNAESFESCSHGAGRVMTRTEAKRRFSVDDHAAATAHVECRKDEDVIDEAPAAYKPIDAVMDAQKDLVEVLHTLHQVVCVKG
jgi:RNA-splicing ligase RtcB